MRFCEPATVEEAVAQLAADPEARCLAGGATLVAMMNADLVRPSQLVSLNRIAELAQIAALPDGSVRIGAMARHAHVANSEVFRGGQRIVPAAARRIGHPAIRNMGTIGGSICHADPAADYPTAITAAHASIEIMGPQGKRAVPAAEFFVDWFETALADGEIVTAVTLPPDSHRANVAYEKLTRADGDFATVSVAACVAVEGGKCASIQVVVGGAAPTPVYDTAAQAAVVGHPLDESATAALGAALAEKCDPVDDARGSAAYRLRLVPRLVHRALDRAVAGGAELAR